MCPCSAAGGQHQMSSFLGWCCSGTSRLVIHSDFACRCLTLRWHGLCCQQGRHWGLRPGQPAAPAPYCTGVTPTETAHRSTALPLAWYRLHVRHPRCSSVLPSRQKLPPLHAQSPEPTPEGKARTAKVAPQAPGYIEHDSPTKVLMEASRRHRLEGGSAHEEEQGAKDSSPGSEGLCCTLIPSADRSSVDSAGADEPAPAG